MDICIFLNVYNKIFYFTSAKLLFRVYILDNIRDVIRIYDIGNDSQRSLKFDVYVFRVIFAFLFHLFIVY